MFHLAYMRPREIQQALMVMGAIGEGFRPEVGMGRQVLLGVVGAGAPEGVGVYGGSVVVARFVLTRDFVLNTD